MRKAKDILRLIFLLFFVLASSDIHQVPAAAETLKWSSVNIPASGPGGNWVLADAQDKRCLVCAPDGSLYCYANPSGTLFRFFKSTDGGYSWSYTGRITDTIVDIAIVPGSPNCIFYASACGVSKSIDAGNTFMALTPGPGGAGASNKNITSLDAVSVNGSNYVVVSIADADPLEFGGVYIWDENQPANWKDTGLRNCDVYAVAFSPNYAADRQIVAVATDEHNTIVSANIADTGWGISLGDARIAGLTLSSASIAFPSDYNSDVSKGKYTHFIGIGSGSGAGDVYCLKGQAVPIAPTLTDLNAGQPDNRVNIDITSLAVNGNADTAKIAAGGSSIAQTYFSDDAGRTWKSSSKPPTGSAGTFISMAPDFASSGVIYALTSGIESAFSTSQDRGLTWSQTGLINTKISNVLDLAISPDFGRDNTMFLLTSDVEYSLWFTPNRGSRWERRFASTLPYGGRTDKILLSPQYGQNQKVYLTQTNYPFIWKSDDNGRNFLKTSSIDSVTGAPVNIYTWAITSGDILFVGSFDGNHGMVYQTGKNGLAYINNAISGNQTLNSLVLSPDYEHDGTILAGNTSGSVFCSNDKGGVFERLPLGATQAPLSGTVTTAFDSDYCHNKTIYAASGDANKGIYRFTIGTSAAWMPIDSSLPAGAKIGHVAISCGGSLYAVNLQAVDNTLKKGGIERLLYPGSEPLPYSETIIYGLEDGSVLKKLWLQGNTLWSIDAVHSKLLTYTDTLAAPVTLTSPANNAAHLVSHNATLSWSPLDGATGYHWQIDTDNQFAVIPHGLEGDIDVTSVKLTSLDSDTTYFWRVRANTPVTSPWSGTSTFDTNTLPVIDIPRLNEPRFNGTSPIQPTFRWTSCAGAEKYELQVSKDNTFSNPVIDKAGNNAFTTDAWICDVNLEYSTGYYWRVRAVAGENKSNWSDISVFTTVSEPTLNSPSGGNSSGGNPAPPATKPAASLKPTPSPAESAKTTPTTSPRIIPVETSSSSPAVSPSPTIISDVINSGAPDLIKLSASGVSANLTSPTISPTTVTPTYSASSGFGESTSRWLFPLVGGLVLLTLVLVVVIILMLRKFKKY